MSAPRWMIRDNREMLAQDISKLIGEKLTQDILHYGKGSLVLPGGTTPDLLYRELVVCPIEFDHIDITLSDERWVDETDARSNTRKLRSIFSLTRAGIITLKTQDIRPELALSHVSFVLSRMKHPFTSVVVGMGEDGHIASLFPGHFSVLHDADYCVAGTSPDGMKRISLTMSCLTEANLGIVLIHGSEKRKILEEFLLSPRHLPVVEFLRLLGEKGLIAWAP